MVSIPAGVQRVYARKTRICKLPTPSRSEKPYRLARDIRGIGFKTADAIAMKLGRSDVGAVRGLAALALD